MRHFALLPVAFWALQSCGPGMDHNDMNPSHTVESFRQAFNAHQVEQMMALSTPDAKTSSVSGLPSDGSRDYRSQWAEGFEFFPDFQIRFDRLIEGSGVALAHGWVSGQYVGTTDSINAFELPAAWRVVVVGGKVSEWEMFTDYGRIRDILLANQTEDSSDWKVGGFGGVFFKAKDPAGLAKWYDQHLGTRFNGASYTAFKWRESSNSQHVASTTFGLFSEKSDYYAPSTKPFMVNFRVNNLDSLLLRLKNAGITQVGETDKYDYGNFAWIMDPEGNKIELWQPVDEVLEKYEEEQNAPKN